MSDNYRVTVTCPVELAATVSAVGRAMDIDVGGADSFVEEGGMLVARTWANESFAGMFQYLLGNPDGLHLAIASDYASRWQELEPPSLPDVAAFCAAAKMTVEHE